MIGGQHLLGVEPDMRRVGTQEGGDVGSARQLVEPALFDRFEVRAADSQAFFDLSQVETTRITLIAQQATDRATRRGFAFQRTPINLIRHDVPCTSPLKSFLAEAY